VTGDGELWKLARKIQENPAGVNGSVSAPGAAPDAAKASDTGAGTDAAAAIPAQQAGARSGAPVSQEGLQPQADAAVGMPGSADVTGNAASPANQGAVVPEEAAADTVTSSEVQEALSLPANPQAGLSSSQIGLVDGQLVMNNTPEGPVYVPAESVYSEPYAMLVYYAEPYYGQVLDNGDVRINLKDDEPWPYVDITRLMDGTDAQTVMTERSAAFSEEHADTITASPEKLTPLMLEKSAGYVSVGAYTEGDVNKNVLTIGVDTADGSVIFTTYYDNADTEAAVIAAENAFTLAEIGGLPVAQ
jgi:hypothetical protein